MSTSSFVTSSVILLVAATACRKEKSEQTELATKGDSAVTRPVASANDQVWKATAAQQEMLRKGVAQINLWRAGVEAILRDPESELVKNGPCDKYDLCHAETPAPGAPSGLVFYVEWFYDNPAVHRVMLQGAPGDPDFNCASAQSKQIKTQSIGGTVTYECRPEQGGETIRIGTTVKTTIVSWSKDSFSDRESKLPRKR